VTLLAFTTLVIWPRGASAQSEAKTPGPATPPPAQAAPPAPAPAPAGDDAMAQAKQHFETGRNAYNAGDYVTAIREFKEAERLRPSPILDYNIGLANEKLGKRRVAVKYYRRYLELQPNAANHAEVEGKVQQLEAEIASQPPPAATAQPGGTAPQPNAQVEQPSDMPPPDPNATAGAAAQPGYDPYASQAPPGAPAPVQAKPQKKKSYWWIGLIIAGGVAVTIGIALLIWWAAENSTDVYYYDHGLAAAPQAQPRIDRHDIGGVQLFRF
jgi:tetratricopeptide (TPR) repeat protein